jgi:hypothetical protein
MNTLKSMFVKGVLGSITLAKFRADLKGRKPWKAEKAEKKAIDAAMVHAVAAQYGFEVTDKGRKFPSGLTIGLPEKFTVKMESDYGAAKTQLSRWRDMLVKPKAATVLTHGDAKKREAARAAKLLKSERDLESFIAAVRRAFAAKS